MKRIRWHWFFWIFLSGCLLGCGGANQEIAGLEGEITRLQGQARAMTEQLEDLRSKRTNHWETVALFVDLNRTLRAELDWSGGEPVAKGRFRNETDLVLSGMRLHVSELHNGRILKEEHLSITFPDLLSPGEESVFSRKASPAIWGFQPGLERNQHRLRMDEVMVAGGLMMREDLSGLGDLDVEITRKDEELLDLRLQIGRLVTQRDRLKNR